MSSFPKETQWISHRGLNKEYLENSKSAFDRAVEVGFLILETDLRISSDGHIVLAHDRSLQRVGGPNVFVDSLTGQQLEELSLKDGEKIVFFEDFIERYAGCQWVFDIKPESGLEVLEALYNWSKTNQSAQWLVSNSHFLFWKRSQQKKFVEYFPKAQVFADSFECWGAGLSALLGLSFLIRPNKSYAVPSHLGCLPLFRKRIISAYQRSGAKTIAYLPKPSLFQDALDAHMDYILTDFVRIQSQ